MHNSQCRSRSYFPHKCTQIYIKPFKVKTWAGPLHLASTSDHGDEPVAFLGGYIPVDQRNHLRQILLNAGYKNVLLDIERGDRQSTSTLNVFRYSYVKASGMLKLINAPINGSIDAPRYIPVQIGMENVLVANGWSFLDPDESEPISAFDLDAANKEGQYKPKWGHDDAIMDESTIIISSLGYTLQHDPFEVIVKASQNEGLTPQAKKVLLEGGTDPPHIKATNNGYEFSAKTCTFPEGIFVCAIGSLPLFTTADLPPSVLSASGGWLSFIRPIAEDHVRLIYPNKLELDQRTEVVDARTGCHLGHLFGKSGYCINASALNFLPLGKVNGEHPKQSTRAVGPYSWRLFLDDALDNSQSTISPSILMLRGVIMKQVDRGEIILGAGCFWHVESSLRRLPGVIETKTGYAGGNTSRPTYNDVCKGNTGHAEVVKVSFDPAVCDPRKLIDCWLAMHDTTAVRAHGKRAKKTGQYRSCVFVLKSREMQNTANDAVTACRDHLGKEVSSEVIFAEDSFWVAEERHQRHEERRRVADLNTLSFDQWLLAYGRRSAPVLGSSESIQVDDGDDDLDDGMARMMM